MHIITGLLLGALFSGKKKEGAHPLLGINWPIRTRHLLPGRVRFQIPLMVGQNERLEEACAKLGQVEGVASVDCSGITGSVLIRFDERRLQADLLFAALIRLLGLERELERTPASTVGKEIGGMGHALNQAVHSGTDGFIDLKTAVPLAIGAVGLYRMITQRPVALPTAFTMVWWAYNSLSQGGRGGGG